MDIHTDKDVKPASETGSSRQPLLTEEGRQRSSFIQWLARPMAIVGLALTGLLSLVVAIWGQGLKFGDWAPLANWPVKLIFSVILFGSWLLLSYFLFKRERSSLTVEPSSELPSMEGVVEEPRGFRRHVRRELRGIGGLPATVTFGKYRRPRILVLLPDHHEADVLIRRKLGLPFSNLREFSNEVFCTVKGAEEDYCFFRYRASSGRDAATLRKYLRRAKWFAPLQGIVLAYTVKDVAEHKGERVFRDLRNSLCQLLGSGQKTIPVQAWLMDLQHCPGADEFMQYLVSQSETPVIGYELSATVNLNSALQQKRVRLEQNLSQKMVDALFLLNSQDQRLALNSFPEELHRILVQNEQHLLNLFNALQRSDGFLQGVMLWPKEVGENTGLVLDKVGVPRWQKHLKENFLCSYRSLPRCRRAWTGAAIFTGMALLAGSATATWHTQASLADQSSLLGNVSESIGEFMWEIQQLNISGLESADEWLALQKELSDRSGQLNEALTEAQSSQLKRISGDIYDRLITGSLLPELEMELREQLANARDSEDVLNSLRMYLMLEREPQLNTEQLERWRSEKMGSRLDQAYFQKHMAYVEQVATPRIALNNTVLKQAQYKLRETPLDLQVYYAITKSAEERGKRGLGIDQLMGGQSAEWFYSHRSIPWLYTKEGYETHFLPRLGAQLKRLEENKSLFSIHDGQAIDSQLIAQQVIDHYTNDFISEWEATLSQIETGSLSGSSKPQRYLQMMSMTRSPVGHLLDYLQRELSLSPSLETGIKNIEGQNDVLATVTEVNARAGSVVRKAQRLHEVSGINIDLVAVGSTSFSRRLAAFIAPYQEWSLSDNDTASRWDVFRQKAAVLAAELREQESNNDEERFESASTFIAKGASSKPYQALNQYVKLMPPNLARWVEPAMRSIAENQKAVIRARLNEAYVGVQAFFNDYVAGKYPFEDSTIEVLPQDLEEFLKPEGVFDEFYKRYVAPHTRLSRKGTLLNQKGERNLRFSKRALVQLGGLLQLQKLLINPEGKLHIAMQVKPLFLDANMSRFEWNLANERLTYRHGPQRQFDVDWQADDEVESAHIEFIDYNGLSTRKNFSGAWAMFRLFEAYPLEPTKGSRSRYQVTFEEAGKRAVYQVNVAQGLEPGMFRQMRRLDTQKLF